MAHNHSADPKLLLSSETQFKEALRGIREIGLLNKPSHLKHCFYLSERLGADVYLKLECLNPANSFKIRGVTHFLWRYKLQNGAYPKLAVTASGGNHGLAVAVACHYLAIPCLVVLPSNSATPHKIRLLERYGAKVEIHGTIYADASAYVASLVEQDPKGETCNIPAYSHPWVVLGQGTVAMEILDEIPNVDTIICSAGGGGLLCGISSYLQATKQFRTHHTECFAVETDGADLFYQSHSKGAPVVLPTITSIATTLGATRTEPWIFEAVERGVKDFVTVSDNEAVEALLEFLDEERLLVEPATSCVISAVCKHAERFGITPARHTTLSEEGEITGTNQQRRKKVVLVVCGNLTSIDEVKQWTSQFGIAR